MDKSFRIVPNRHEWIVLYANGTWDTFDEHLNYTEVIEAAEHAAANFED